MKLLQKLQNLPEGRKKIIVWGVTILMGIGLFFWGILRMSENLKISEGGGFGEQFQLQELQEQLENIPLKTNGDK